MNDKLRIALIVIAILVLIRLIIFPVYTKCSGNDCRVIHLNRLTGHAYYSPVYIRSGKKLADPFTIMSRVHRIRLCKSCFKDCYTNNDNEEYLNKCYDKCKKKYNIPDKWL